MIAATRHMRRLVVVATACALLATACGNGDTTDPDDDADGPLVVYSGRSEELVGDVFDRFTAATGIEVSVRYGDTAELAVTILEEGDRSPADVYFGQDAGALGALEANGRLSTLSSDVLDVVEPVYRSSGDAWIGVTGRVRVVAYSTERVSADELPASVFDITDERYRGRVGYAPTNGSFQAFITAMRISEGEDVARQWMEALLAIDPLVYQNNSSQLEAIARGEIDFALTNHYYLHRFLAEDPSFPVDNHYLPGDIGGLVNVAGVGIVDTTSRPNAAAQLVAFLLSEETQTHFGQVTDALEFPLRSGIDAPDLPSLESLDPPQVDLTRLDDLQGTLVLLEDVGAFE